MKRSEVRAFLKAGVDALVPVPEFGSGRESEFAAKLNKKYPVIWQTVKPVDVEITDEASAPLDRWEVELIIAKLDAMDSSADQYEEIIDECDLIAQKLVYKYRNIVSGYKLTTMDDIGREPFIKKKSPDVNTGVMLTFTLVSQDKTNVC